MSVLYSYGAVCQMMTLNHVYIVQLHSCMLNYDVASCLQIPIAADRFLFNAKLEPVKYKLNSSRAVKMQYLGPQHSKTSRKNGFKGDKQKTGIVRGLQKQRQVGIALASVSTSCYSFCAEMNCRVLFLSPCGS